MPKKKFIDKKNATTFVIGHRSQKDPLLADETAPQNILIPLDQVPDLSKGGISAARAAGASASANGSNNVEKRIEEQRKFGIYFDDDYDYLQHLKDSSEVSTIKWDVVERIYAPNHPKATDEDAVSTTENIEDLKDVKIKLPSSVFESEYQEQVGLLNKAFASVGPRPDLDPDVVAALDEDFDRADPENELEDDFVQLANEGVLEQEVVDREPTAEDLEGLFSDEDDQNENGDSDDGDHSDDYEDEEMDSVGSLNGPQYSFQDEETKSQFTNYSMSSSVVRRNKQLLLVDDRFEKFFEAYEDTEIGALDCDEIEGDINPDQSELLMKYAAEFQKEKEKEDGLNDKIRGLALVGGGEDESEEDDDSDDENEKPKEKWDCQSIISTYSTTKNRPKIIREPSQRNQIKISGKTGLPVGVFGKGLTKENLKLLDNPNEREEEGEVSRARSILSGATSIRNKNETAQERRERKQLVKEYRKERRIEKKANTTAFKDEKKRMEKVRINGKVNVQGLKL